MPLLPIDRHRLGDDGDRGLENLARSPIALVLDHHPLRIAIDRKEVEGARRRRNLTSTDERVDAKELGCRLHG
jgi:hypothetical protein